MMDFNGDEREGGRNQGIKVSRFGVIALRVEMPKSHTTFGKSFVDMNLFLGYFGPLLR
jgi:hypothetical protein